MTEQLLVELFGDGCRWESCRVDKLGSNFPLKLPCEVVEGAFARSLHSLARGSVEALFEPAMNAEAERCVSRLFVSDAPQDLGDFGVANVLGLKRREERSE